MSERTVIHLVGIGGIGMSGLARMYRARGYSVQGSDLKHSAILDELERTGTRVFIGHDASHVSGADLVVYSSSIKPDHPERLRALELRIPVIHRAEALARLCEGLSTIAVTGTHGKTTTTSLVGSVLREAGRDPSIVVGGLVPAWGGNAYPGLGPEIVIEADESDSSFLRFSPAIEVITNIEADHLDHFAGIAEIEHAFRAFIERMPEQGVWLGCGEDARVRKIAAEGTRRSLLYGFTMETCDLWASELRLCPGGRRGAEFTVWSAKEKLGSVAIGLIGRHNVLNALAAIGVALELGVPFAKIAAGLAAYQGARRRFDVKYEDDRYLLVDDYAHHPTEIRATLLAAKALKPKRLFAVFQPHRYSRTEALMADFAASFGDADKVLVTDVYAAGEAPRPGVGGDALTEEIAKCGHTDVSYVPRDAVEGTVRSEMRPGDIVLMMGAGDISDAAGEIAGKLHSRPGTSPFLGLRGKVVSGEPLSKHTTLRVGGPAEYWIEPEDNEDLKKALAAARGAGLRVTLIGWGSNVLPPDEGIKGAVIHLGSAFYKKIWSEKGLVIARAGAANTLFIQFALENGYGGCEFLSGIPGCIGGAVAMNAGSHRQSVDAILESVETMSPDGTLRAWGKKDIVFGYREADLKSCIVIEASFRLPKRARAEVEKVLQEYREHRARTQDLQHPSAGCMFKNLDNGERSSGKLIDEAGLKGRTIGGAQISEKHANFIINRGGATAKDVRKLIEEVQKAVKERTGVTLEPEVKFL